MLMSRDLIYGIVRQLQSTSSLSRRNRILAQATRDVGHDIEHSTHDRERIWHDIQQSGLFNLLTALLSEPDGDFSSFAEFLQVGLDFVRLCLVFNSTPNILSPEWEPILRPISVVFRNSVPTVVRLLHVAGPALEHLVVPLQRSGVLLLARILPVFGDLETSAEYFDVEHILHLVLGVLFGPQNIPVATQSGLDKQCGKVMVAFPYDVCVRSSAIEVAQKRYGYDDIALRCAEICSHPYDGPFPFGLLQLMTLLNHVDFPDMNSAFLQRDVYSVVLQGQWEFLKIQDTVQTGLKYPEAFSMFIMTRMFWPLSKSGTQPLLTTNPDIFRENDIILFLGKAFLAPKHALFASDDQAYDMENSIRRWGIIIVAAYRADPNFKADYCQVQWSHIMQRLLILQRCNSTALDADTEAPYFRYDFAVRVWSRFGEDLQLAGPPSEEGAEAERVRKRCSWMMCPLNSRPETAEWDTLRCTGCRQAYYCGLPCQRRHWRSCHRQECLQALPLSSDDPR